MRSIELFGLLINLESIIFVVLVLGSILGSVLIELVVAFVCKLNTKKALLNVLFINLITHGLSYIFYIKVVQLNPSNYTTLFLLFEVIILSVKFTYLYWLLQPRFTWKHIALYLLISQIVSYLLGILRYY